MLRRMSAEQSPAEEPSRTDTPPAAEQPMTEARPGPPAPTPDQVPPQQPPVHQQPPQGQPYAPPPYQQQPYPDQYQQYPPQQGYPQQPYPQQQYPEQQQYQQQPPPPPYPPQQPPAPPYPPQQQYPEQQYPQQPYPPQQGYPPPPPPPQQYAPPGQVPPYQPAPYEQYAPPYQQYPPYEQQPPAPPYQQPYVDPQYQQQPPPYQQQHPGQAPYQEAPPPPQNTGWGPAPTQQPAQPGAPEGDSVFKRFRRFANEAAYLVGASGRMQRDVDNIATIRRPIAIMRRVGVLSPVTNGGTSTVSALLAMMLAAQRSDRVVTIDADPSGAELSRRLELTLGAGPIERVSLVRSEGTADAVRQALAEAQGQGARDVGLAVVDCPGSMYDEVSMEMASSAHCVVLVIPSVQHVANYCLQQLDQLTPDGQNVLLTRGVVVITMVEPAEPSSVSWLMDAFRQRGLEPLVLPYDAHIAQAWPLHAEQIEDESRRAVLDLSARVVETVTGTAG